MAASDRLELPGTPPRIPMRKPTQISHLLASVIVVGWLALLPSPTRCASKPGTPVSAQPYIMRTLDGSVLGFEVNLGQASPQVKYLSRGNGSSIYLTATGAVLMLSHRKPTIRFPATDGRQEKLRWLEP